MSRVHFDEDNLEDNKQFQGYAKIEEPKTPYHYMTVEEDHEMPDMVLSGPMEESLVAHHKAHEEVDWDEQDEADVFQSHRKVHYKNEGDALKAAMRRNK